MCPSEPYIQNTKEHFLVPLVLWGTKNREVLCVKNEGSKNLVVTNVLNMNLLNLDDQIIVSILVRFIITDGCLRSKRKL